MTAFSTPAKPRRKTWTIEDLHRRVGPIPFEIPKRPAAKGQPEKNRPWRGRS
jgi:hypothetical protein